MKGFIKKGLIVFSVLILLVCASCTGQKTVTSLTYAVYPYLPDVGYYQELIERRWAEIEPDIRLVRAEWDCYSDGAPEGIDVVMYDAVMRDVLIENRWIQPIDETCVQQPEDIFPFALDGLVYDGKLYGIPVFLCGYFLMYDRSCDVLAEAEHITDLADESEILVIASDDPSDRADFIQEIRADALGTANPAVKDSKSTDTFMALIDRLAIDAHTKDSAEQAVRAYDEGVGKGYIGFSESMRFLARRASTTDIKSISFSDKENLPRMYVDAAAVTDGINGKRLEKCIELMNVIAEPDTVSSLSVQDGRPQYLLLARKSAYAPLAEQFPLYRRLEEIALNERNFTVIGR